MVSVDFKWFLSGTGKLRLGLGHNGGQASQACFATMPTAKESVLHKLGKTTK